MVELKLKELLSERALSQKKFAEMAGLRPEAVSRMVRNHVDRMDMRQVGVVMKALGIESFDDFFRMVE